MNVFPLVRSSIDFDFDTAQIVDQNACDALAAFIRLVGATANPATVEISHEGSCAPVLTFNERDQGFRFL